MQLARQPAKRASPPVCRTTELNANRLAPKPLGGMSNQDHPLKQTAGSRAPCLGAILAFSIGLCTAPVHSYAQGSDEQATALLRASSTQSAIITFCAHHYEVDGTTALRISKTARDVAAKVLGQDQADAAFKVELARRYAEVKEVGEQQWCADQRAALAQSETPIFKN